MEWRGRRGVGEGYKESEGGMEGEKGMIKMEGDKEKGREGR